MLAFACVFRIEFYTVKVNIVRLSGLYRAKNSSSFISPSENLSCSTYEKLGFFGIIY